MTLLPSYGKDYRSIAEVKAGLEAGHDFEIASVDSPDCGRYAQAQELRTAGVTQVTVRYKAKRSVTIVDLRKLSFKVPAGV